jgi:hypothetical protein
MGVLASLVLPVALSGGGQITDPGLSAKAAVAAAEVAQSAKLAPVKGDDAKGLELQSASRVIWKSVSDVSVKHGVTDLDLSSSLDRVEVEIGTSGGKRVFASAWVGSVDRVAQDAIAQSYATALGTAVSKLGVTSCSGTLQCVETCVGQDGKRKCCKYRCVPEK